MPLTVLLRHRGSIQKLTAQGLTATCFNEPLCLIKTYQDVNEKFTVNIKNKTCFQQILSIQSVYS